MSKIDILTPHGPLTRGKLPPFGFESGYLICLLKEIRRRVSSNDN